MRNDIVDATEHTNEHKEVKQYSFRLSVDFDGNNAGKRQINFELCCCFLMNFIFIFEQDESERLDAEPSHYVIRARARAYG